MQRIWTECAHNVCSSCEHLHGQLHDSTVLNQVFVSSFVHSVNSVHSSSLNKTFVQLSLFSRPEPGASPSPPSEKPLLTDTLPPTPAMCHPESILERYYLPPIIQGNFNLFLLPNIISHGPGFFFSHHFFKVTTNLSVKQKQFCRFQHEC